MELPTKETIEKIKAARDKWDGGPAGCEFSDLMSQHLDSLLESVAAARTLLDAQAAALAERDAEIAKLKANADQSGGEMVLDGLRRELWLALDHYHVVQRRGHSEFNRENGRHGGSPWRELFSAIEAVSLPPELSQARGGG